MLNKKEQDFKVVSRLGVQRAQHEMSFVSPTLISSFRLHHPTADMSHISHSSQENKRSIGIPSIVV